MIGGRSFTAYEISSVFARAAWLYAMTSRTGLNRGAPRDACIRIAKAFATNKKATGCRVAFLTKIPMISLIALEIFQHANQFWQQHAF